MKLIATLFNILIIGYLSISFTQSTTFRRSYDVGAFDNAGNMVQTPDGGYAFGGINAVGITFYGGLTKTDANGDIEWSNAYVSGFASVFTDIKNVSTGGYIATGESTSGGAILVRINNNGTVAWANRYETPNDFPGKPSNETGNSVIETSDGGFVVGGSVSYFWDGVSGATVDTSSALGFKVDATGNVEWSRVWTVNVANPDEHFFNDVTETSDGYIFVGASSEGSGTLSDGDYPRNALVVKTDKVAGNTTYIHRWGAGNSSSQSITSAITLSSGSVLISGGDGDRAFLRRIQGNGSTFTHQYGRRINNSTFLGIPQDTYILQSIDETSDGQYAFIGMRIAIFSFPNSFETVIGKIDPATNNIAFVRGYSSIGLSSILPKGGVTATDEFYTVMTDQQMTGFNYNLIKTDDQGLLNSTLAGCPNSDRSPSTSSYNPTIQAVPNSQFTGLSRTAYTPVVTAVSPTEVIHCLTTVCSPPPLADNVTATTNPICAGQSTTINASGPGTDVSYNVYDAATGGTNLGSVPLSVSPGTTTSYFVETVDNTDPTCVSTSRVEIEITVNPLPTVSPTSNSPICVGEDLNLSTNAVTGGTYSWTGPNGFSSSSQNPTITGATAAADGTYSLTVTANGCPTGPITTGVTVSPAPTANAGALSTTICSGQDIELTANTVSGGTYSWTGPNGFTSSAQNPVISGAGINADGIYSLDITIGSCPSNTSTVDITVNLTPTVNVPAGDDEICVGEIVNITPNSGGTWSSSDPSVATISNTGEVEGISAGTVDMTFTDGTTGCESTGTAGSITVNASPTVTVPAGDDEICIGEIVNITPNSGGTWSSSDPSVATITNAGEVEGISAGTVDMTFTDGTTGCESTGTAGSITVNLSPTVTLPAGDDEICIGEIVNITPNSGGTWSSSDPSIATITNAGEVEGISAGTVDMTFTDGTTGCESTGTAGSITVNASPTVTVPAGDDEICVGEIVNITPNSGGTWSSSDPSVATITNAGEVEGISAGTVDMTFTDGTTGCESTGTAGSITVNASPTVTVPAGDDEICVGEIVNITPNSGGTWSSSDPSIATITNAGEVEGISAGTVDMTFTDGTTGCESTGTNGEITVNLSPTVTVPAGDDEICVGEIVNITPNSGGTWSSSDPSVATITNAGEVEGISAGTVDMTFTDGTTGCESTGTAGSITVNASPTVTVPAGDDEICVGEIVNITPNSGGTWSSSDPSVATISNTGEVEGISAGTVDMTFTDGTTGCESTGTAGSITVNARPTVTVPAGDDEICVGETVTITPTSGGTWSSSDPSIATITNGGVVDGLTAGIADMTFTDGTTGCSNASGTATITVNTLPTLTAVGTDISCNGEGDGEATVTPVGNGPFNYNWSPSGGSGATATGLDAGTYTVVVTDDNGCESNETVTINEPDEIILSTSSTQSQCTIDDGTATVNASGGSGTYDYLWTPSGQTTATATGIGAGSYNVEVTDDNNCTANATVIVESVNGPTVSIIDQENVSCIGANDGFAEAEASGGTPGYSYSWSPSGGNQATTTGLGPGTYTVEVTDDAGCTAINTVDITSPDALTIDETITDASCGQTDGAIVVNVSGGTPSYTYDWTPNVGNTSTIGNLSGGSYDLTVTDANGCQITQTYNVSVSGALPINITPSSATIDAGESVDLDVITDPGVSGESYTWTPGDGLSCTDCPNPNAAPDETTTYYVEVTTPDGCSAIDSILIVVDQPCGDIFVPTIFSPNNDGTNDLLCVYGGCISALEFQIYNRWGELIFTTNDNTECWDGTHNGDPVNTGVYVYKINVTLSDGEEVQDSGNVNVVR